ncbi:hypothetical protein ALQ06_200099 [Pseudomonas syringae pv. berberidis]|nr:hypothetical protein ALQ06_200099 [Pseudomonas syringae pv. berberidis]
MPMHEPAVRRSPDGPSGDFQRTRELVVHPKYHPDAIVTFQYTVNHRVERLTFTVGDRAFS